MTMHQGRLWRPVAAAAMVMLMAGCGQKQASGGGQGQDPVTVDVVAVQARPLALSSELPGRIEPVRVAEVRARVAGIVLSRHFEEGSDVKAGDVLFRIDPAPLRMALSRAQGELARTEATLGESQALVRRYQPLVEVEAVSRQDFEAAQAALRSAKAARQSAQAEVDAAKLNLDYATVKAPISGRVGRALVTEGALVGQGEATPMALIQQLSPVYADFQQSVADVQRLRAALAEGRLAQHQDKGAPIALTVDGTGQRREGRLMFSDVTVDRNTGQMALRGLFDNRDGMLLPGMYVRVKVGQGVDPAAILVPQRAVQRGADGKAQVLVVDAQDTLQMRAVQTGTMHGAQWHITEGLKSGERVVTGRMAAVQPGTKVKANVLSGAAADTDASSSASPAAKAVAAPQAGA